jgi:signal transduction histidine kinase
MPEALTRVAGRPWFDPALAALLSGLCLVELVLVPGHGWSPAVVASAVLLSVAVAVRRTHPLAAALLQTAVLLAATDRGGATLPYATAAAVLVVAYSCGAHAGRRRSLAAVLALAAAQQVHMGFAEFPNFEVYFVTLPPWWIGVEVGRRRRLVRTLQVHAAQLEAEEDAFAQLAVRLERARIARELHDIVAHHLAAVVVQAGAGRMAPDGPPDAAARRAEIRRSGEQALAEMARLVDVLESDGAGLAEGLRALVDQATAAGLDAAVALPPAELRLPAPVAEAVRSVVREGLTNVIKHAPGAAVRVEVRPCDGALEVEVRDTGATTSSPLAASGAGLGLAGMRERVEALGGRLEAGAMAGGGWRLRAGLPRTPPG